MSVETPGVAAKLEEAMLAPEADHSGMSSALRRNLSSPWATAFVIILTILWTIPTLGLLITSLRPSELASDTGWWTVITNPVFTLQAAGGRNRTAPLDRASHPRRHDGQRLR